MQSNRHRWITHAVVAGVVAAGAWSLASVVEPDGGSRPGVAVPARAQLGCTAVAVQTMTTAGCSKRGG